MRVSIFICFSSMILMSCATTRSVFLRQLSPAFHEVAKSMEDETSLSLVAAALPAHLKLAEGLLGINLTDPDILGVLIQGYSAQGLAVFETQALDDQLSGHCQSEAWREARLCYGRAINYGERFLMTRGISTKQLMMALRENRIKELLERKLSKADREPVFYLAQAIALAANLDKSDQKLVSHFPFSEAMMSWVCLDAPDFHSGLCPLFTAVAFASRPEILGGDAEKARGLFVEAIKKYPDNFFIRSAFIQYSVIPRSSKVDWQVQKDWFEKKIISGMALIDRETQGGAIPLLNSVALRRFEIFKRYENRLF